MARPDFRGQAAERLSQERELSPQIISLLSPDPHGKGHTSVRTVPLDRIDPNPQQPRMSFDEDTLRELAASITEHGVLQPILVRPSEDDGRYQLVAGERRWRAARIAGLHDIPALIEEIDDDTALEISIIENLQREDLSPLDEALMYERMTTDHGYSLRRLAQKLGKDKGYIENRLRLADAPAEIKQLVSLRKDTLSHAYELLKVDDPRKRRKLAEQVGRGELSLVKLRERIDGRPPRRSPDTASPAYDAPEESAVDEPAATTGGSVADDSLISAKAHLGEALDELSAILRSEAALSDIDPIDRQNLAKYLTIAKLRLDNVITQVRLTDSNRS
ncbi:MAG: ParB/RepB/Spo0J family partition protein [Chloroflexota bacterium]|nr:ParB/RepB/Spo0J family partition protein [Chloroflexota bacterium]